MGWLLVLLLIYLFLPGLWDWLVGAAVFAVIFAVEFAMVFAVVALVT